MSRAGGVESGFYSLHWQRQCAHLWVKTAVFFMQLHKNKGFLPQTVCAVWEMIDQISYGHSINCTFLTPHCHHIKDWISPIGVNSVNVRKYSQQHLQHMQTWCVFFSLIWNVTYDSGNVTKKGICCALKMPERAFFFLFSTVNHRGFSSWISRFHGFIMPYDK